MSERETVDGSFCARSDTPHRSHKLTSRSRDKHSNSGSYGRRGRLETPPTSTAPTRHPQHHHSPHGYGGKQTSRERRKGVRGRVDNHGKLASLPAAQCASVGREGRKKTSLNHLLNFTLSPRETHTTGDGRGRRRFKTHSYNKEQFLQANCQFVVSDRGDYSIHTSDPDLLVDWDSIELVRLFCHEIPSCPICLYPPRAAKMTRCGHVYCWSCVLHYLSLGEKNWRKCPICYESIYKKDLKSVVAMSTTQYSVGDVISMRLMVREKDSTLVLQSSEKARSPSGLPSLSAVGERFVKLLTCTTAESLQQIVLPERDALTSQLEALSRDEESEQCFVELALEELKVREMSLRQSVAIREEENDSSGVDTPPRDHRTSLPPPLTNGSVQGGELAASSDSGEGEGEGGGGSVQPDSGGSLDTSMEQLPSSTPSTPPDTSLTPSTPPDTSLVYFYQAADGQHLYLHTVNARCLVKEYGGLEFAPEEIKAHIVEMEQLSMTEEARGRYKYLSHLPVTCEFALCELDLQPPLVSRVTLAHFQDDLDRRRHKRTRKRRDERRREKNTAAATQKPVLSNDAFPLPTSVYQPLSPERIHDLLPQLTSSPTPPHTTTSPLHTPSHLNPVAMEFIPGLARLGPDTGTVDDVVDSSDLNDSSAAHPSFAEALRGKSLPIWPKTPSRIAGGKAHPPGVCGEGEKDEGEEGNIVPSFKEAFTEALLTAQVSTQQGQCSKKTAKKGRKKLVLFSTGGARGTHN